MNTDLRALKKPCMHKNALTEPHEIPEMNASYHKDPTVNSGYKKEN